MNQIEEPGVAAPLLTFAAVLHGTCANEYVCALFGWLPLLQLNYTPMSVATVEVIQ